MICLNYKAYCHFLLVIVPEIVAVFTFDVIVFYDLLCCEPPPSHQTTKTTGNLKAEFFRGDLRFKIPQPKFQAVVILRRISCITCTRTKPQVILNDLKQPTSFFI